MVKHESARINRQSIDDTITRIPDNSILVDVLAAIGILRCFGKLHNEKCDMLTRLCSVYTSNKERLIVFALDIFENESVEFLLYILDLIGLRHIANAIEMPVSRPIHRPELTHSKHLQTFYYTLKNNIDMNTFCNREEYLRNKYTDMIKSFSRFRSVNDLHKNAGRFAVVTWLLIQHCNRNTQRIRDVLNGMLTHWPRDVDDTLAIIFYNSKMAIAAIMDGDVTSAEDHSRIAKHLSASFKDPLTKSLICHDSRYTNQRIFELQRSEQHREAILDEAIRGLCFLESDSNGCELFNLQMKRMFLLYVAQFKLNIHNDLNSRESYRASAKDISLARNAIDSAEKTLRDREEFDPRRGMVFYVCLAKVHESRGEYSLAEFLLFLAMKQAEEGAHYTNESQNIREFKSRLLERGTINST